MTDPRRLRLGIVGCGAVAREYHLPALAQLADTYEIRCLCDQSERNLVLTAKQFGVQAKTCRDIAGFAGEVDVALVALPPRWHAPVSIELLNRGIDVLCEKPLATSSIDAERMVAAAREHQRVLGVGLMTRYHPNNAIVRSLLEEGFLGDLRAVEAEAGAPLDWTMTDGSYYDPQKTIGGAFYDSGVHLLDRVGWLLGAIIPADYEDDSYGGVESNAILRGSVRTAGSEIPCQFRFSWTHHLHNRIRIIGRRATADLYHSRPLEVEITGATRDPALRLTARRAGEQSAEGFNPFRAQWEDFARAVWLRQEPVSSAASAIAGVRLIEQAYAMRRRMIQPWVETRSAP